MKARRNLYLGIASLLIVINIIGDLSDIQYLLDRLFEGDSLNIGYFIGSQLLLIIGLIFIRFAIKIHKRIKSHEADIENSINQIGKS